MLVGNCECAFIVGFNGVQLKITREVLSLVVFAAFAVLYLKKPFHRQYLMSFALILGAASFALKKYR